MKRERNVDQNFANSLNPLNDFPEFTDTFKFTRGKIKDIVMDSKL